LTGGHNGCKYWPGSFTNTALMAKMDIVSTFMSLRKMRNAAFKAPAISLLFLVSIFFQGCASRAAGPDAGPGAAFKENGGKLGSGGELPALLEMGRALVSTGMYVEAQKTAKRAARLGKKLKDEKGVSAAYDLQAEALLLSGSPEKALKALDRADKEPGEGRFSGTRLNLRGLALMEAGRHEEAFGVLMSALDANRDSGDSAGLARSYRALGLAAMGAENRDALRFFNEAYRLDREANDMANVGYDLGRMAEIALQKGRVEEAVFLFERSYAAYMEAGSEEGALKGVGSLIDALRSLGQDERAGYYSGVKEVILKKIESGGQGR